MRAFTVPLPDDKHRRLRALASSRGTTINRLIDEMTTLMLSQFDVETRLHTVASTGDKPLISLDDMTALLASLRSKTCAPEEPSFVALWRDDARCWIAQKAHATHFSQRQQRCRCAVDSRVQ